MLHTKSEIRTPTAVCTRHGNAQIADQKVHASNLLQDFQKHHFLQLNFFILKGSKQNHPFDILLILKVPQNFLESWQVNFLLAWNRAYKLIFSFQLVLLSQKITDAENSRDLYGALDNSNGAR